MFDKPWIGFSSNLPEAIPVLPNGCQKSNDWCLITVTSLQFVNKVDGNIMIRLEHLCTPGINCEGFEAEENFDFKLFFHDKKVQKVTEYNLIGNFPIHFRKRLVWETKDGAENENEKVVITNDFITTIKSRDLKTFIVQLT